MFLGDLIRGVARYALTPGYFLSPLRGEERAKALVASDHLVRTFPFRRYLLSVSAIMKTLLLLRHAKPEDLAPGLSDSDRKLMGAGKKQARELGLLLRQKHLKLDLVLCSPAARARETAELVISSAEQLVAVHYDPAIYESGAETLLQLISQIDNSANVVLLVGHNPAVAELTTILTHSVTPFPPGTMARINFDLPAWTNLTADSGQLAEITSPST